MLPDLSLRYDVVIAGAGPAGCVLASRLSEDPRRRVLLAEAGPDIAAPGAEHPDVLDPFCLSATENPAFQWPGLLVEGSTASLSTQAAPVPRPFRQGFGIGGGSNMNGMAVDRGLPEDYEEWSESGARGWNWQGVLPYFRRVERDLDFTHRLDAFHSGTTGPMPVRRLPRQRWAPFSAAIGDALQRRGFPFLEDYLSDFREGFSAVPTNSLEDRRVSAAMAYLSPPVRQRTNLAILSGAHVDRITFGEGKAQGVVLRLEDRSVSIAARQIIVACGALQSPALLLRSGIGPAKALAHHDIAVVADLPGVGANLQNHPSLSLITYLRPDAAQAADNPWFLQNWLRFSSRHPECSAKDMHLMAFNKCAWHSLGRRVGLMAVSVLKPYSRGSVQLASADPMRLPKVQFNILEDERDEARLTAGLSLMFDLLADPAVATLRHELLPPSIGRVTAGLVRRHPWNEIKARALVAVLDWPACRRLLLKRRHTDPVRMRATEDTLRQFVRQHTHLQAHVCGTCRMGLASDPTSVVDNTGRVHGIEGVYVADASIFPTIPRGYTHFIVLMAAEKLADAIRAERPS